MTGAFHHTPDPDEATLTDRHEPYAPLPPRTRPFVRRFLLTVPPDGHAADERCPGCPHEGRGA